LETETWADIRSVSLRRVRCNSTLERISRRFRPRLGEFRIRFHELSRSGDQR